MNPPKTDKKMESTKEHKKKRKRKDAEDSEKEERRKRKKEQKKEDGKKEKKKKKEKKQETSEKVPSTALTFPHKYILAPMVGASELAFRLLCRQYGTQLAYTPMMNAQKFAHDEAYRAAEFQTCAADRPLVCHFSANTPQDFADAARTAAPYCDAIDLNLGCPQRTAYLGHFGSYLLDDTDRELVCSIVKAGAKAVNIPIFCKIRLLDTLEQTIQLCQQLEAAGASLVAVHARYRASWERKGPGARDGPALLDQVTQIKQHVKIPVIANGNTITYEDVVKNLELTTANGLMSAEGILDNPALFLPRLGKSSNTDVRVPLILPEPVNSGERNDKNDVGNAAASKKKERKLTKKLREIGRIEEKLQRDETLIDEEKEKLSKKSSIEQELEALQSKAKTLAASSQTTKPQPTEIALSDLYQAADNKLQMAHQYLDLATRYPVKIRSVVFHTRRMLKDLLVQYQLLETCLAAETIAQVRTILQKMEGYQTNPASFVFDKEKEKAQKEALERKKREEGKRKAYEARMMRKAKREGRTDLQFYLHQGAAVPLKELVEKCWQL